MKLKAVPFVVFTIAALVSPAWADVPPPDQCSDDQIGKACDNALGADGSEGSGICEKTTCKRASPTGPITYDCAKCVTKDAPAEPAPAPSTAEKPAAPAEPTTPEPAATTMEKPGTVPPPSTASKGGCSTIPTPTGSSLFLLVGALVVSAFSRRRRVVS